MYTFKRVSPRAKKLQSRRVADLTLKATAIFTRMFRKSRKNIGVNKVLENEDVSRNEKQVVSYKLRVFYSIILIIVFGILYKIFVEFSLAQFSSQNSFTVLVQTPKQVGSTVVQQSVIAFRGRGNEVTTLTFPNDLSISVASIATDEAQAVGISQLSAPQLARETGIITDAKIVSQFPHTFPSKYSVVKLLLRGLIGTEQMSSLKWSDRISMILYLLFMHSNEYRVVVINPAEHCADCVEQYLKTTIIPRYLLDTLLTEHATTVGVINQTGINGLAKNVSDIFKAHGFSVVHISSDYGHGDASKIIVTKEAHLLEHEITKIQKLFDTPLNVEVQPSAFTIYRSDIVVVIGNDRWPINEEVGM